MTVTQNVRNPACALLALHRERASHEHRAFAHPAHARVEAILPARFE